MNSSKSIIVEKVAAFGNQSFPKNINSRNVQLNCPPNILESFQKLLTDTDILGASFKNPYTRRTEVIPSDPRLLTARHLQILARNENYNTNGTMNTALYNKTLTADQIAQLRCLVKATNVAGITYAHHTGGFKSQKNAITPAQKVIVVDQAGLQWQGDFRNTGGMFFYPEQYDHSSLPENYLDWQNQIYTAMYGIQRPANPENIIDVKWKGVKGKLDLDGVSFAICREFIESLDAIVSQGNYLADNEIINFKFLKAGMGFFAAGLGLKNEALQQFEKARLDGIALALQNIQELSKEEQSTRLGKVKRLELPYSDNVVVNGQRVAHNLNRIRALTLKLLGNDGWGDAEKRDAFKPNAGYINACNNCGDPHAMIGNEGGYESVDSTLASNSFLDHLNAGFNKFMQLREMFAPFNANANSNIIKNNERISLETICSEIGDTIDGYKMERGNYLGKTSRMFDYTRGDNRANVYLHLLENECPTPLTKLSVIYSLLASETGATLQKYVYANSDKAINPQEAQKLMMGFAQIDRKPDHGQRQSI